MRRSRYIFIFVFLLLGLCANAKKPVKKEIVFLTPYEAKTQIIQQYIESAQNEFADTSRYRLHFYAVYEYVGNYFTKNEYARDLSHLLERIMGFVRKDGYKPDLFIINQDFLSQAVAKSDDPLLKSTPILCIDLMHPEWNGLLKNSPNITVIENEPAVKENIDFITDLGFSNYIVTVMDSTYIDDHLREHILSQLGSDTLRYRPNLHLEQVDRIQSPHKRDKRTTLFPISIMNPEKNNRHPDVPGGFDLEWIFYTRAAGYLIPPHQERCVLQCGDAQQHRALLCPDPRVLQSPAHKPSEQLSRRLYDPFPTDDGADSSCSGQDS